MVFNFYPFFVLISEGSFLISRLRFFSTSNCTMDIRCLPRLRRCDPDWQSTRRCRKSPARSIPSRPASQFVPKRPTVYSVLCLSQKGMVITMKNPKNHAAQPPPSQPPKPSPPLTSYHEITIGKTLYRVTSVYKGEIELKKALEELTISRALRDVRAVSGAGA